MPAIRRRTLTRVCRTGGLVSYGRFSPLFASQHYLNIQIAVLCEPVVSKDYTNPQEIKICLIDIKILEFDKGVPVTNTSYATKIWQSRDFRMTSGAEAFRNRLIELVYVRQIPINISNYCTVPGQK